MELEKKIEQLKDYLKDKKVLIAFSGGADSSLVAYVASNVSKESLAVTIDNGVMPTDCIANAIKIAEAIWLPIYGNEIYKYKPFKAKLIGGKVWEIYGTVYTQKGGSPIAKIRKSDCKIIEVTHEL